MIVHHGSNMSVDEVDCGSPVVVDTSDLISHHSDEAKGRNCLETGLTILPELLTNLPHFRLMLTAEPAARAL